MRITVTVRGEPDVRPYKKRFQFQEPDDEVFVASHRKIKGMLDRQQRININDALLLFAAFVVSSVTEGKDAGRIIEEAASILSPQQVMIGVPEMLRGLDFEIVMGGQTHAVSIDRPIPAQYFTAARGGQSC